MAYTLLTYTLLTLIASFGILSCTNGSETYDPAIPQTHHEKYEYFYKELPIGAVIINSYRMQSYPNKQSNVRGWIVFEFGGNCFLSSGLTTQYGVITTIPCR